MTITNVELAMAIAAAAIARCGLPTEDFVAQDAGEHAAYEGVTVHSTHSDERVLQIYLCNDDKGSELWMIDPTNVFHGTIDPQPLTAEFLQFCMEWLVADAWLVRHPDGSGAGITTDYDLMRSLPYFARMPLNGKPRGQLLGWIDPTTGDLASDDLKETSAVYTRFTKPLYCAMEKA